MPISLILFPDCVVLKFMKLIQAINRTNIEIAENRYIFLITAVRDTKLKLPIN